MKVKITYATEVDSVKEQISKMLISSASSLESILKLLSCCDTLLNEDENSPVYVHNLVDTIRKELALIDQGLDDAYSILTGYVQLLNSNNNPVESQDVSPPEPTRPPKRWNPETKTYKEDLPTENVETE